MFRKPILKSLLILPLSFTPALILFSIVLPFLSEAIPIRLEKNGLASLRLPRLSNKSPLSIKNCLLSGNEISNLERLVIC